MFYTLYTYQVHYVDGQGEYKTAIVKAREGVIDEVIILHAAMDQYGDHFAQEYRVILIDEERKLSLFDRL